MEIKSAELRALLEGVLYGLRPITDVYNVKVDDSTTLADKLQEIITSLNGKVPQDQLQAAIADAVEEYFAENPVEPGTGGAGADGEDGFSPIAKVTQTEDGAVISITDADGTTTATVTNGKDGNDGTTPHIGSNGNWYIGETDTGVPAAGSVSDRESIVQEVIAALGTPVFGTVDEDNNIILSGDLAGGTYTVKYEKADGSTVIIGTIAQNAAYKNILPLAITSDGTLFNNGQGYQTGYRLNSSGAQTTQEGACVTGFIPVSNGDTVYLSDITLYMNGKRNGYGYVWLYDENFNAVSVDSLVMGCALREMDDQTSPIAAGSLVLDSTNIVKQFIINRTTFYNQTDATLASVRYIRISADNIHENSIVTVNEPIE